MEEGTVSTECAALCEAFSFLGEHGDWEGLEVTVRTRHAVRQNPQSVLDTLRARLYDAYLVRCGEEAILGI